jgi:predicted acetyltransferase
VIGDAQCPEGFAILKPGSRDEAVPQALVATDVAANTPAALSRLVTLIHDHRSMNNRFKWYGGSNDSLVMMAREQHVSVEEHHRWMLRIIDLRSALQGRGYRSCCAGELHFDIKDDLLPENSGRWILRVADGRGSAQRGGQGHLQMHVRSLAPLFSAYYSPSQLAQMGLLAAADSQQLALADAVFAGPSPWVSELF